MNKRCGAGKNCGATCISRKKVCQLTLDNVLSEGLHNISKNVKGMPPDRPITVNYNFEPTIDSGKKFMGPYKERLKSAFSREERAKKLIDKLEDIMFDDDRPLSKEIKGKIKERIREVRARESRAFHDYMKTMLEIRNKISRTDLPEEEIKRIVNSVDIKTRDSKLKGEIESEVGQFVRMFNGRGLLYVSSSGDDPSSPVHSVEISPGRPNARLNNGTISLNGSNLSTTFHELGHFVERLYPLVSQYAVKWRDSRALTTEQLKLLSKSDPSYRKFTSPENLLKSSRSITSIEMLPTFKLNSIVPFGGFDNDEVAFLGRYMNPYMGKVYPGFLGNYVTEVTSMALQSFATTKGMADLYRSHPDLFEMAVGLAITPAGN